MVETLHIPNTGDKSEIYKTLLPQIKSVIAGKPDQIANQANVAAILMAAFSWHWVGFYRVIDGELVLGPFQGPLACTRIQFGRGVCGTSASKQETIIVPDVNKFPGHIACSALSQSEIVVPRVRNLSVEFILDVDSEHLSNFDEVDAAYLQQIVDIV